MKKENEYEIATKKVLPKLLEWGWPRNLISPYGRVPVEVGTDTVWADYVCYISENYALQPWLLIEVKVLSNDLNLAVSQAESYSLILHAPFFCVTDGKKFDFYKTGLSQGVGIPISKFPIPAENYLQGGLEFVNLPKEIDALLDSFFLALKENEKFLKDTKEHHEILKYLREHVLNQIDNLTAAQLKERLTGKLMLRVPAIFFSQIDDNLSQVKSFLHFIVDFMKTEGDSLEKLNSLLEENSSLRIKGLGICGISQFLAAAYPNEFIVLEDNISKAIRHLNITDVLVKQDTANAYLYINEICKKMHDEKMKERLKQYDFGLPAVHNFLWHYYKHYLSQGIWY